MAARASSRCWAAAVKASAARDSSCVALATRSAGSRSGSLTSYTVSDRRSAAPSWASAWGHGVGQLGGWSEDAGGVGRGDALVGQDRASGLVIERADVV